MIQVKSCRVFNIKSCAYSFIADQDLTIKQGDIIHYNGHEYKIITKPVNHVNGTDYTNGTDRMISLETLFRAERL
ncbi:hypothetical protein FEM33_05080 [Dyadobacter flavalbus]|uniref:Uncharacterized protein n=1 Tax=Dyadobacter flavalbus TaxID=2579942 RepID=A0A5M8R0S5_9BACT|nr:hypothetical protein [Dyadobacter flavalbus]KAA6440900.1 hypothetical protein FEM33_05080 [Dyadobacter flavalbus]